MTSSIAFRLMLTVSVTEPGALKYSKTEWPPSPRDCLVFVSWPLGVQARNAAPGLLRGCWGSNSGPHVCVAGTLPAELLPSFQFSVV